MSPNDIHGMALALGLPSALAQIEAVKQLVAEAVANERERMIQDGWRQCATGQRTTQFCGQLQQAVAAEREACAKVCESLPTVGELRQLERATMKDCAHAIRARGKHEAI